MIRRFWTQPGTMAAAAGFVLVAAFVLVVIFVERTVAIEKRAAQLELSIYELKAHIAEAEASSIRYVQQPSAASQKAFEAAQAGALGEVAEVRAGLLDPRQRERFPLLETKLREQLAALARAMRLADDMGTGAAEQPQTEYATRAFALSQVVDEMRGAQLDRIERRTIEGDRIATGVRWAIGAAAGLTVLLLVFLIWALSRSRERRANTERRFAFALAASRIAAWEWTRKGDQLSLSAEWGPMLGGEAREMQTTSRAMAELMHPEDAAMVHASVQSVIGGKLEQYDVEHRVRALDGSWIWIRSIGRAVERDARGKALRSMGTNTNITLRKTAELRLAEREARLSSVLGNLPGEAYRRRNDAGWSMEYMSAGVLELTGYPPEAFLRREVSFLSLVDPADVARVSGMAAAAIERREPFTLEYRIRTATGRKKWVWERGAGVHARDGSLEAVEGLVLDITERRRELRLVLDSVPAMIAYVDFGDRIRYHNHAYAQFYGVAAGALEGRRLRDFIEPTSLAEIKSYRERVLAGEHVTFNRRRRPAWGGEIDLAVSMVPSLSEDGAVQGYYTMQVDVTELRRVARMKDEFISVVSHELRTPLTSIRGALSLLAGPLAPQLPEKARALSAVALASSVHLARLIDDILDLEKLQSGKLSVALERVDVASLAAEAMARNQTYAQARGVSLDLAAPRGAVWAQGDPERLHQVFANLISNAVKHSAAGGVVGVAVTASEKRLRVAVRDHGTGVPEEFRPRLFEKFSQAEGAIARSKEGTGLGLAISKAIVEGHGGTIGHQNVEDADGGGALFWFELGQHGDTRLDRSQHGPG